MIQLRAIVLVIVLLKDVSSLRCYWCSGVGDDRECEFKPWAVTAGPGQAECATPYCVTAKVIENGRVQSFARLCADIPRGNVCVQDSRLLTCFHTCTTNLCNHDNPDPSNLPIQSYSEAFLNLPKVTPISYTQTPPVSRQLQPIRKPNHRQLLRRQNLLLRHQNLPRRRRGRLMNRERASRIIEPYMSKNLKKERSLFKTPTSFFRVSEENKGGNQALDENLHDYPPWMFIDPIHSNFDDKADLFRTESILALQNSTSGMMALSPLSRRASWQSGQRENDPSEVVDLRVNLNNTSIDMIDMNLSYDLLSTDTTKYDLDFLSTSENPTSLQPTNESDKTKRDDSPLEENNFVSKESTTHTIKNQPLENKFADVIQKPESHVYVARFAEEIIKKLADNNENFIEESKHFDNNEPKNPEFSIDLGLDELTMELKDLDMNQKLAANNVNAIKESKNSDDNEAKNPKFSIKLDDELTMEPMDLNINQKLLDNNNSIEESNPYNEVKDPELRVNLDVELTTEPMNLDLDLSLNVFHEFQQKDVLTLASPGNNTNDTLQNADDKKVVTTTTTIYINNNTRKGAPKPIPTSTPTSEMVSAAKLTVQDMSNALEGHRDEAQRAITQKLNEVHERKSHKPDGESRNTRISYNQRITDFSSLMSDAERRRSETKPKIYLKSKPPVSTQARPARLFSPHRNAASAQCRIMLTTFVFCASLAIVDISHRLH